ncbi:two-component regulator propeller domain-containing protein [Hugenholtzia roseola]|uniref:two-component regulator propeller domain-containing protein n=1 Tax=Hugenholtzia roseola TaxID=1002 RepID=UPI000479C119|nr:two-component regulator propeller domain-containing protein [Hugenholtzia roseola]
MEKAFSFGGKKRAEQRFSSLGLVVFGFLWLFFQIFGCFFIQLLAQEKIQEKRVSQYISDGWDRKDGLPSNTLQNVYCSKEGYLWIASYAGLTRFDGFHFETFDGKNTPQIQTTAFSRFLELPDSSLWATTTGGGGLVRYQKGKFESYSQKAGLPSVTIDPLILDASGKKIWVGTRGKGIFQFDLTTKQFKALEIERLKSSFVFDLYQEKNGTLWIGTEGEGLFQYFSDGSLKRVEIEPQEPLLNEKGVVHFIFQDRKNRVFVSIDNYLYVYQNQKFQRISLLDGYPLLSITEDSKGDLWLGTPFSLLRFDFEKNEIDELTKTPQHQQLHINGLTFDREGSLWAATYRFGLLRLRDGNFTNYTQQEGLATNTVNSFFEYEKDKLLVCSDNGKVNLLDAKNHQVSLLNFKTDLGKERIRTAIQDQKGNFWIGSYAGLLKIEPNGKEILYHKNNPDPNRRLLDNQVRAVVAHPNGDLWIGTRSGGIEIWKTDGTKLFLNKNNGKLPSNFVMHLLTLKDGRVLVSTNDNGIAFFSAEGKILRFISEKEGLGNNLVFSATEDAQNQTWIATNGKISWLRQDGRIFNFSPQNGLPFPYPLDVKFDEQGALWVSSSIGLVRIAYSELEAVADGKKEMLETQIFDRSDGMVSSECIGAVQMYETQDRRIWIPTMGGISVLKPTEIQKNLVLPPVYLQAVQTDQTNWYPQADGKKLLTLDQNWQRLTFRFAALSYIAPEKVRVRYQLKGYDQDWIEAENLRQISYTRLPAGRYEFRLMAANSDGLWNRQGVSFAFVIQPRFHETTLFYLLSFVFLVGLITLFYRWRIKKEQQQKLELQELVLERTREILNQKEEIDFQRERAIKAYQNIQVLSQIGQNITATLDMSSMTQKVYQLVNTLLPAEGFGVGIYVASQDHIEFRGFIEGGLILPTHAEPLSDSTTLAYRCFVKGEEIWSNQVRQDFADLLVEQKYKNGMVGNLPESLLYMPLKMESEILGVITVQSFQKGAYTETHVDILRNLASYIAIAVANSKSYEIIREKNTHITDSIRYAEKIQRAILPPFERVAQHFGAAALLFQPKDIVSGDFFWFHKVQEKNKDFHFLAVVDCTGHGVPGAFMSLIGNILLNEIVKDLQIHEPAQILEVLDAQIRQVLRQKDFSGHDGMDLILCRFQQLPQQDGVELVYAGAKRPLLIACIQEDDQQQKKRSVQIAKTTRRSIGGSFKRLQDFEQYTQVLYKGDRLFLTTDGYTDQANPQGDKIGTKLLLTQLEQTLFQSLDEQFMTLKRLLNNFSQQAEQRDDITLLGIEV